MDRNLFNLDYDYIFNVFNYRNEYKIEKLREEIIDTLDSNKFYINEYGDIMCSIDGAKYIAEYINIDIEPYLDTLRFLNSANFLTEDKIPLKTDIYLKHDEDIYINHNVINKYISGELSAMSLLGNHLKDIEDPMMLSNKDRETINGSIDEYNNKAKEDYEQHKRLKAAHKYIQDNDPDINKRAAYNLGSDYKDIDRFYERSFFMEDYDFQAMFEDSSKRLDKMRKKSDKKKDKKNKKKDK